MVELIWSPTAENDLIEIIDYIAQDSPHYAVSFYEEVQEKVENLINFPKIGRRLDIYVYISQIESYHLKS